MYILNNFFNFAQKLNVMVKGVIYKYTSPDGSIYIGQTLDECHRRGCFFLAKHYAGRKLDKAREKFGPENFTYERLVCKDYINTEIAQKELDVLEDYYIKKYDSIKHGYNTKVGNHSKRKKVMGYNPNRQYKQFKMEIKSMKKARTTSLNKAVAQYDLDGNFITKYFSISEAARATGIDLSNISRCCTGKMSRTRNFIFRFI